MKLFGTIDTFAAFYEFTFGMPLDGLIVSPGVFDELLEECLAANPAEVVTDNPVAIDVNGTVVMTKASIVRAAKDLAKEAERRAKEKS